MIEGLFIEAAAQGAGRGGFHTTFFVEANNAKNAVHRVQAELQKRLQAHGISLIDSGAFKTYFWVHDIWEITREKFDASSGRDSGFTFFPIGRFEGVYLSIRHIYFSRFKPWLLVPVLPTM
jgi:hypothetical protein